MPKLRNLLFGTLALILSSSIKAQEVGSTPTEDFMVSEGKIYVVVAVVVTIITGLFLYLYRIDKKISRLEKNK